MLLIGLFLPAGSVVRALKWDTEGCRLEFPTKHDFGLYSQICGAVATLKNKAKLLLLSGSCPHIYSS